jgi:hypothetical protein
MTYHNSTVSIESTKVVLNAERNAGDASTMVSIEIYTRDHERSREKLAHTVYIHSFDDLPFEMFNGKLEMGDKFELLSAIREPQ